MSEELKPCPFKHLQRLNIGPVIVDGSMVAVECGCGAQGPVKDCEADAIAAWNDRAYGDLFAPCPTCGEPMGEHSNGGWECPQESRPQ